MFFFTDWVLIGENQECAGSDTETPNDDPEYFLLPSIEECAVACAGKGRSVFAYGKSGSEDRRCYKPSEADFGLGRAWSQITDTNLDTDKCVCLCEYETKEGHCRYGATYNEMYNLYRQVSKGKKEMRLVNVT